MGPFSRPKRQAGGDKGGTKRRAQSRHMGMKNRTDKGSQKAQGIHNPQCPKLLSLRQASQTCGLTLWALRELVWKGRLSYVQFEGGEKIWIDEADLASFLHGQKRVFGK